MKIILGGDVVPTKENNDLFSEANVNALLEDGLLDYWLSADFRVINLECPITNSNETIIKQGPRLVANMSCFKGLKALNPSLVLLANNHIMDAGESGLLDLLQMLKDNGLKSIGAGKDLTEISSSFIINDADKKVGIYVLCDREFSAAENRKAGANAISFKCFKELKELSKELDYLITVYHGGKEYYRYPTSRLQELCHEMVDAGSNLVICQHSHCIGSEEEYNGSTILYGQGNFIFNKKHDEFWGSSLLVEINTENGFHIKYVPIIQTKVGTRLASNNEAAVILNELENRSCNIVMDGFIVKELHNYSNKLLTSYLYSFAGWNPYLVYFDKRVLKGFLIKRKYSKKQLAAIWNYINCEAHREVIVDGIAQMINMN